MTAQHQAVATLALVVAVAVIGPSLLLLASGTTWALAVLAGPVIALLGLLCGSVAGSGVSAKR